MAFIFKFPVCPPSCLSSSPSHETSIFKFSDYPPSYHHETSIYQLSDCHHSLPLIFSQSRNQPDSYEFSIRTPVTPPRWKEFDAELEAAFEAIIQAMLEGAISPMITFS
jgi:hypothetical protein